MSERPFRFGVQATRASTAAEWKQLARTVEDLGYSTLSLADHYGDEDLAPIAAMATAAAVTSTLRIGCRVFCVDYHVPAVLAKEAATLDLLSDGRLDLGVGAGWSEPEYEALGVGFAPGAERLARLEEVVALLKGSLGVPIMVGGAKRRMLSFAAREADIVSMSTVPFDDRALDEARGRWGWVRSAAGDRLGGLDVESAPVFAEVTDDPVTAAEKVARTLGVRADGLLDHPNVLIGSEDEVVDCLLARREVFGVNYVTVPQHRAARLAPVVARLRGR